MPPRTPGLRYVEEDSFDPRDQRSLVEEAERWGRESPGAIRITAPPKKV